MAAEPGSKRKPRAKNVTERKRAEDALRESVELYRTLFNNTDDGFVLVEPIFDETGNSDDYRMLEVNDTWERQTGLRAADLVGKRIREALPNVEHVWPANFAEVARTGNARHFESYNADSGRWYDLHAFAYRKGQVGVLFRDITRHKRAEEALAATHRQFQSVIDNTPYVVYAFDMEERFVLANAALAQLLGSTPEQMIGKRRHEFMPREDADWHESNDRQAIEVGSALEFEEFSQLNGRSITWLTTKFPLRDAQGRIYAVAGISTDISERKRTEEERERLLVSIDGQRRQLQAVMDAIPAGVVFADATGKLVQINEFEKKIWGGNVPLAEKWMEYGVFKGWWHDTGKPLMAEEWGMTRALIKGETILGEIVDIERFDGTRGTKLQCSAPVKDARGNITGAVTIDMDITDRIKLEKDLNEAKMQAELYLDLMGHDINNMHQIAMGYLEMARDMRPDAGESEFLDKPLEVLQRSARLIQNVRKLQNLKEGVFQSQEVDVCEVLGDLQREFGAVPHKVITLNLIGLDHCHVRANELLHDVFANLVSNAIRHTNTLAQITIDVDRVLDGRKLCCRVIVEDDGPGILDGSKGHVFNRMHKGSPRGMGLGLYLVKSLVESYGGRVWVEDRVNGDHMQGARFVVILPTVEQ